MKKHLNRTTEANYRTRGAAPQSAARSNLAAGDDFFQKLGINSLQALELLTRLEDHFKVELPDYEVAGVTRFPHSSPAASRPRF